jgi:PAS domain S-box-containing protein
LRTITDNSLDDIFVVDRRHHLLYLNPSALATVSAACIQPGASLDELLGKTPFELFGDTPEARQILAANERVMASAQAESAEDCIVTPAGARYLLASRAPFRDAEGRVIGLVGIARDITERKQIEADRLASLVRQRDVLVREVHHRIKNHLQGVTGLLRSAMADSPEITGPIQGVIEQSQTIAQVYGLQCSHANAQVHLDELVRLLAAGTSGMAPVVCHLPAAQAQFNLRPEDMVPLALVINELLSNAVKHLAPADPQRPVQVSLEANAQQARIEIRGGPAHLPEGFDFQRRRGIGTGLELVATLLPSKGASLVFRQIDDEVVVELSLDSA